jgi:hypothetical protein
LTRNKTKKNLKTSPVFRKFMKVFFSSNRRIKFHVKFCHKIYLTLKLSLNFMTVLLIYIESCAGRRLILNFEIHTFEIPGFFFAFFNRLTYLALDNQKLI